MSARTYAAVFLAGATAISLAGCGSSKTATAPTTSGGASAATGAPIKLLTFGDYTGPNGISLQGYGGQARVAEINAKGGIAGHKLELQTCDSKLDPNVLAACLQKAIADGVVAVVGGQTVLDPISLKITDAAKLPEIGFTPSTVASRNSPYALCLSTSPSGLSAGLVNSLKQSGATKVNGILPGGLSLTPEVNKAFSTAAGSAGLSQGSLVDYDLAATDYGPIVAKATAGGVNGVGIFGAGPAYSSAIKLLSMVSQLKVALIGIGLTQDVTSAVASVSAPLPVVDYFKPLSDTSVPGVAAFMSDMTTYEPQSKMFSSNAVADWIGVYAFEQIAKSISGPITRASITTAMFQQPHLDTMGLTPTLDTSKRGQDGLGACTVNPYISLDVLEKGVILADKPGFIDPATGATTGS